MRPRSMLDLLLGLGSRCPRVGCRVETGTRSRIAPSPCPVPLPLALHKNARGLGGRGGLQGAGRQAEDQEEEGEERRNEPVFTPREQSVWSRASVPWARELRTCAVPPLPAITHQALRLLLAALPPAHTGERGARPSPRSPTIRKTSKPLIWHPTLHLYFYYLSLYIHEWSILVRREAHEGRRPSFIH